MSKKSKSETGPSKFAQPFVKRGADALDTAYNNNAGKIQGNTDFVVGGLLPDLMDRFNNGDQGVNAARDYGVDVLSGQYLNNNPHLQGVIDSTNEDVSDRVNAIMGLRGLTGGSPHAGVLTKELAKNTANLRYSDYARERGAQDAAASRAGGIAAADYLPVAGLLSTLQASTTPVNAASQYAGGLGALLGNYTSTTQKKSPWDTLAAAAGTAAGAFAASERRVKKNIERIGELPDGLGLYSFNYKWEDEGAPLHSGVMVDEVEKLQPQALGPIINGIQTVDYSKLETAQ